MNAYRLLMRLQLLNGLAGFRRGSWRKENGKLDVARIVTTLFVLAAFAVMAGMVIWLEVTLFSALEMLHQPTLLPGLALFAATVMTLILGLFATLTTLYMGKDLPWLATLPVPQTAVLAMKWTNVYAGEAVINLGLVAPAAILYGLHIHADILYYVRALTIMLATPLLPLALTTLLSSLLARITGLTRHRELTMMLGSLALVAVVWGTEFTLLPHIPDDADAMYIARLLLESDGLINLLLNAIPPVRWAVDGLQGDWLRWALYLAVSLGVMALVLLAAGRGYLDVCLRQSEQSTKRRAVKTKDGDWRQRSPLAALFHREWSELVKNPVYAMNTFSGVIVFPVMMLAMYLSVSSSDETADFLSGLAGLMGGVSGLDKMLIFAGCMAFPLFINNAASTAVSREGGRLMLSRMLPLPTRTLLTAKLLTGLAVCGCSILSACVVLGVVFRQEILWILLALPLPAMLAYASSAVSLTIDAIRPRLNWTDENQALKQNFNTAIAMLFSTLMIALAAVPPFFLLSAAPAVRFAVVLAILAVECAAGFLLLHRVAERRYAELEG